MLDLEFSPEQEMLRQTVRGVCQTYCDLSVVRSLEDDPIGFSPELWKQLGELDVIGLMLPDEYGGAGMTTLEGVVLYEELGRGLVPVPHFVSAVLCGGLIAEAGDERQKDQWMRPISTGGAIFTIAWLEPEGGFGPLGVQSTAKADGDGYLLSGTKVHVAFARAADHLVVLARTGEAAHDIDLFVVDSEAAGVTMTQQLTIASDTQFEVRLQDVRVPASARIGPAGSGWRTFNEVMMQGAILMAAYAMGGAAQALDITVQYAKDRVQFDKPLGAFQAIAHYLADAVTTVDGGTTLVHQAAWAQSTGRDIKRLAPMSKLFACQTFRDLTAMAQQVFGGIGFTVEFDIQLYFRRAKALELLWWDTRHLQELVAEAVIG